MPSDAEAPSEAPPEAPPAVRSGSRVMASVRARPWRWAPWALAIPALLMIVAMRLRPQPPPVFGTLPAFALTDQHEHAFSRDSMRGHIWIANFIFTSCNQSCPMLTEKMAGIQTRVRDGGIDAQLVSFSVDPETDTPARLLAYGTRYHADPARWYFVTGPLGDIQRVVVDGFKVLMGDVPRPRPVGFIDIVHGNQFVLVDRQSRIRGYFHADPDGINELMTATRRLTREH